MIGGRYEHKTRSKKKRVLATARQWRRLIEQRTSEISASSSKYGVVKVVMPEEVIRRHERVTDRISSMDLGVTKGIEHEPHVTIIHGLHNADPDPVREILELSAPIRLHFGKVRCFLATDESPFDVLYIPVVSPQLPALHAALRGLPGTYTYPHYTPHMTLAYLRPGRGLKYDGMLGLSTAPDVVMYEASFRDPMQRTTAIELGKSLVSTSVCIDLAASADRTKEPPGPAPGEIRVVMLNDQGRVVSIQCRGRS